MKVVPLIVALVLTIALGYWFYNYSGFFLYEHNSMQYMPNMYRTKVLIPQRGYEFFPDGAGARVPPEGALAQNQKPYPYTKENPATDIPRYSNPLPASRAVVLRGQKVYLNTCVVCHGVKGQGDGSIIPPFSKPPSLTSEKLMGFADSQIYHIVTVGQNIMGSYAPVLREEDRWAAIHYVRVLQRAKNPTSEDLDSFDELVGKAEKKKP